MTYLGSSFFGGVTVALINHFSQSKRYEIQLGAENKNYIMRKKLDFIYEINKDLKDFDSVTRDSYLAIIEYMNSPLESRDNEIAKHKYVSDIMDNSKIREEGYLEKLNLNLTYFPKIKSKIKECEIYLNQKIIVMGFITRIVKDQPSYVENRVKGIIDKDFEKEFKKAYKLYCEGFIEVEELMKTEMEKVVSYFEESNKKG